MTCYIVWYTEIYPCPLRTFPTHAGTFAVVSLMTGSVVERLVPVPPQSNDTGPDELALLEGQRIGVAAAMAFLVGLLMVSQWLLLGLSGAKQVPGSQAEQAKMVPSNIHNNKQ